MGTTLLMAIGGLCVAHFTLTLLGLGLAADAAGTAGTAGSAGTAAAPRQPLARDARTGRPLTIRTDRRKANRQVGSLARRRADTRG